MAQLVAGFNLMFLYVQTYFIFFVPSAETYFLDKVRAVC